jgi:hypothetical protein
MPGGAAHSYEEIREIVVSILLGQERVSYEPTQFVSLVSGVAEVLCRRDSCEQHQVHRADKELVRDVFWDLFRQGYITIGLDNTNSNWPFFRLSHFGKNSLQTQSPYRFHDATTFLAIVRREIPDISPEAVSYLEEAVGAFYAGCLLASCVMLGVAAEAEFLRLLDGVAASENYRSRFESASREAFIRRKVTKFHAALRPILPSLEPRNHFEDIDINLNAIQSILRIARNDAGHPTATFVPDREQVYVNLQLFVPFARQMMRLRQALS